MAALALALFFLYFVLAVGARMVLHKLRTGSSGLRGIGGGRPGPRGWLGRVQAGLFVGVLGPGLAGPALDLAGVLGPVGALDGRAVHAAGVALYALGLAGTFAAQLAMGASWRIGVDGSEKTPLVTGGPFALVRNPIFSAMILAFLGLALLVPSPVSLVGLAALVATVQSQVRFLHEPYLLRTHAEG